MDKKRSILNVTFSFVSRFILLVTALIVRRLLIRYIGNDINGLNSLYASIIGMLGVAELGIGRSIIYSMYSPVVAGDQKKVAALYNFYGRLYRIIGSAIFGLGMAILPFLPKFISDYEHIHVNVYLTYSLTLVSVVLSYLYSAKTSLIEAYKDNYITTAIITIAKIIRSALQIASILIWKSYEIFLICQIVETILIWIMTEAVVRNLHGDILDMRQEFVDKSTKEEIARNARAMFMHRVGSILVATIDSVIISTFIGVAILGKYSNYTYIAGILTGTISIIFSSLTSIVGHLCAAGQKEEIQQYFHHFYALNYILGFVFYLGYYAIIDHVLFICFGAGLEMSHIVAFIVTLNQFTSFMRQTSLLFRNASGTFYNDRWKPVAEGVVNLLLSLVFVHLFPDEYKVVGVIVATIITTLLICYTVEPYIIFRHVFNQSSKTFCMRNYIYTGIFVCSLVLMTLFIQPCESEVSGILINGFISVGLSMGVLGIISIADKAFRNELRSLTGWIRKQIRLALSSR